MLLLRLNRSLVGVELIISISQNIICLQEHRMTVALVNLELHKSELHRVPYLPLKTKRV